MQSLTYADLFWVIVVALILAVAYILWTTREKKETEKNLFREKKGSSSLTVLIEIAAFFIFGYIFLSAIGELPESAKNGVSWVSSNFTLLAFLACFTIGAYVLLKFSGNKKSHWHGKTTEVFEAKEPLLFAQVCHLASWRL